jgi:hypothetical protein
MGDNVREFSETYQKKRAVGAELDELLERREGFAVMARKMTEGWVSEQERDAILAGYNEKVGQLDSQAAKLRHQIELLDAELDRLAGVKRG